MPRILRNSETDPLPDCLLCGRHASSSSGFGFRVYSCSLLFVPRHESAKWDSPSVHQVLRVRLLHLHVLQWACRKDRCWARRWEWKEQDDNIRENEQWKDTSMLDEVERRSAILRSMTYFVHHGKVLNDWRTIDENNIWTETTIEMSLRLLGRMEKSELMDTLESEEDGENKKEVGWSKRRQTDETKWRGVVFLRKK